MTSILDLMDEIIVDLSSSQERIGSKLAAIRSRHLRVLDTLPKSLTEIIAQPCNLRDEEYLEAVRTLGDLRKLDIKLASLETGYEEMAAWITNLSRVRTKAAATAKSATSPLAAKAWIDELDRGIDACPMPSGIASEDDAADLRDPEVTEILQHYKKRFSPH
jgi:hypothetical protein